MSAGLRVRGLDGDWLEVADALAGVRALNHRSAARQPDAWRYMVAVASQVRASGGGRIRVTSPAVFLLDLAAAGLIEMEGDPLDAGAQAGAS